MQVKSYLRLMRLDKPIGTLLLLWPTLWAIIIASRAKISLITIIIFSLGVFLTRSAGCVINDIMDVDFDQYVKRTSNRALPQGEVSIKSAWVLFIILCLVAFLLAICFLKIKTILLSILALFVFMSYPYMKRIFILPQLYLGIAFSFGILMAFVEIQGGIPLNALLLFMANLCWVTGYDTFYALADKADDLKIGIKTSAIAMGEQVINFILVMFLGFIILLIVVGVNNDLKLPYWLCLSIASSLLIYQVIKGKSKDPHICFKMFLLNNWVGVIILIGIYFSS
jgi:4-hydroxybenzoate polyprenyltransferase